MSMHVTVTSPFWERYRGKVVDKVIPYQWEVINDEREIEIPDDPSGSVQDIDSTWSHAVRNLRVAAGDIQSDFKGFVFQDSDVYKWLEEAAYSLVYKADEGLQELCDRLIDLIARAQRSDGYLDTPYLIGSGAFAGRRPFTQLQQSHEMYVMGHYIEAGVAYYEATGNEQALEIAKRMGDCLDRHFGEEEGKIHGADGHPEIELALARLYEVTRDDRYLKLAVFFIKVRGQDPDFYDKQNAEIGDGSTDIFPQMRAWTHEYTQTARPINEQNTAEGHAVRAVYLLTGIAHVARLTHDEKLKATAERLWADIVRRRMYVTGGIGSTHVGEAFTYDYDLPNDTLYAESCASVGLCFAARQMLEIESRGEYGDILEREIFNGAISGMALDGQHFFYVNPLEADPQASRNNPDRAHVLMRRAEWFGCACCPANIARLIASIDRYIYAVHEDRREIVAHQFIANDAEFFDGIRIKQESNFPWDGHIHFTVTVPDGVAPAKLLIRIPEWSSDGYGITINGSESSQPAVRDGFASIGIRPGSTSIALSLDMSVRAVRANSAVRHDVRKVAIMRGPVVFCAEESDNVAPLWNYRVPSGTAPQSHVEYSANELEGVVVIKAPAFRLDDDGTEAPLYMNASRHAPAENAEELKMIPYYAWANRTVDRMQVWFDSDI
ncbi:non-reducing end beta-L-arabinofuranosidase [Bifidobacterium psychraerophilum DSM 22366]|nr:non-reducing end beta-L-arabinofuranosidase [Bifidobacterium psychraerophilum DSM 22366]